MKILTKTCVSLIVFLLSVCYWPVTAQNIGVKSTAINYGEKITYDIYFKWGLIMPRAGDALFSFNKDNSVSQASSRYEMSFKTAKFFDSFFRMRDTLACYFNDDNKIIYSRKGSDEGGYYSVDELTFNYENGNTSIHSLRYTPSRVRIDTVLTVERGDVTDLLGALFYLRNIDFSKLRGGETYPITVAIGRDIVKVQFVYQHQAIVEHGKAKYNTLYFKMNIYDDAFESTSASAEVWVGNDDNFLPVKVRSKLKIGYAEIYYKESSNLAHPLKCRIETNN